MAVITPAEALGIVSLSTMKLELRIDDAITEHDGLLARQITDAANFIATAAGVALADLGPLRPAITSAVRQLYDGYREIRPDEAFFALMQPFRSYKAR